MWLPDGRWISVSPATVSKRRGYHPHVRPLEQRGSPLQIRLGRNLESQGCLNLISTAMAAYMLLSALRLRHGMGSPLHVGVVWASD